MTTGGSHCLYGCRHRAKPSQAATRSCQSIVRIHPSESNKAFSDKTTRRDFIRPALAYPGTRRWHVDWTIGSVSSTNRTDDDTRAVRFAIAEAGRMLRSTTRLALFAQQVPQGLAERQRRLSAHSAVELETDITQRCGALQRLVGEGKEKASKLQACSCGTRPPEACFNRAAMIRLDQWSSNWLIYAIFSID